MSGECEKCGEHTVDCKCPIIREIKWVSKEEAKERFPSNDYCECVHECRKESILIKQVK